MKKNKYHYYLVFIVNIETDKITQKVILRSSKTINELNEELNMGVESIETNYIYQFLEKNEGYDRIEEIDAIELVEV